MNLERNPVETIMSSKTTIRGTTDAWESGQLGTDKKHAKQAPAELQAAIDDAIGMQPISIRLPRSTIQAYKELASIHGVGYQPLMRDAICRFAEAEMKRLLAGAAQTRRQEVGEAAEDVAVEPPPRKRAA
jgi:hypothetical protein